MRTFGFVIVRHVNSALTNQYWLECYQSIRKFYKQPILIVDDHSNNQYLSCPFELVNCTIVNSEFPVGKAEILGYYYFHKTHFVDKAVVLHDSVFLNYPYEFMNYGDARSLWSFRHVCDWDHYIIPLIKQLDNHAEILNIYMNKRKWLGNFGIMNVITWDIIDKINIRYKLFERFIPLIKCREDRSSLERIFPVLCILVYPEYLYPPHIINDIHLHSPWGLTYTQYKSGKYAKLRIIKIWTGR